MNTILRLAGAAVAIFLLAVPAESQEAGWADRIVVNGDTRLRYEGIDEDGEEERNRMRFRARFNLATDITDDIRFVFRLATGGDNPTSTNQTFDDGFSTKDIGVDRAYIEWDVNDQVTVFGGKMPNPMFRAGGAQIIWDNDLNFEGFAAKWESGSLFGSVGLFSAEERSTADDSLLYSAQIGNEFSLGDTGSLTAGVGYFAYSNTAGNSPFFNGNARGNSVDGAGNYLFDYANAEVFAQFDTNLGDWPLRIFAHYTQNDEVSAEDTAYAFGARIGSAKGQGTSQYSWTYADVEADAVIGTFNDSNFGGANTDSTGHTLRARYMVRDNIALAANLFINEIDVSSGAERDFSRIQLDVEFKFN